MPLKGQNCFSDHRFNQRFSLELGLCQEKLDFLNEVFGIQLVIKLKRQSVKEEKKDGYLKFKKPEYFGNRELSWVNFDDEF